MLAFWWWYLPAISTIQDGIHLSPLSLSTHCAYSSRISKGGGPSGRRRSLTGSETADANGISGEVDVA